MTTIHRYAARLKSMAARIVSVTLSFHAVVVGGGKRADLCGSFSRRLWSVRSGRWGQISDVSDPISPTGAHGVSRFQLTMVDPWPACLRFLLVGL